MPRVKLRVFVEPVLGSRYADQLAAAKAAEECGFDGFFRADHFLTMAGGDGLPGPTDAWLTLAAIARETQRIRLGTMMTSATFRQPGHLAIMVAQVDDMSGGRVELGLGAGWFADEHYAYGFPFPPSVGERLSRLEEQLQIIAGLWATPVGERFHYRGHHYQLDNSPALPKPQQPSPPLIVGGLGPRRTPALAARFAHEFNVPMAHIDATANQFARAREACEAANRDPDSLILSHAIAVFCDLNEARARAMALAVADTASLPEIFTTAAIGTPDQVAERLRGFAAIGATRSYIQLLDMTDLDHLALIAAEVIPLVA